MSGEQVDPDVPSPGPPVLSALPKRLWPGRWWRRRWTWRPRGSAPQSSSSRQPPVYKRRNATANKHTVTGLLKQKKKNQRGLLRRQDKHVVQKYFETEECWNANWEVEGGRGWGVGGLCCEDDSCGADGQHDRSRWPCREVNRLSVNAGGASNLGLGPWPQLLQFLGSRFNGGRRSQQLVLRNDRGVLGVDPLRAWSTRHTVLTTLLPVGGGAG